MKKHSVLPVILKFLTAMLLLPIENNLCAQNDRACLNVYAGPGPMVSAYSILLMPVKSAVSLVNRAPYDLKIINKRLRTDGRLIISGAVLTGAGGALFGMGMIFLFSGGREDFVATGLLFAGAPLIATGVPLLAAGLVQRRKWRKRRDEFNIHAGLLLNGHAGMAMNF